MKEAKSMYKGGEIVYASECNYESAKKMGIVCPFCNEPLFWRDEFAKLAPKSKNIVIIDSHFVHYPNVDGSICEKRSITPEGRAFIEQISSESRGQRLRLFERHFLNMIAKSLYLTYDEKLSLGLKAIKEIEIGVMRMWNETTREEVKKWMSLFINDCFISGKLAESYVKENGSVPEMINKLVAVEMRLQEQIAVEAATYVLTDKKQRVLKQLILWVLWDVYGQDQPKTQSGREFLKMSTRRKQEMVYHSTLLLIATTRWQEMINIFKDVKPKESKGFGRKS